MKFIILSLLIISQSAFAGGFSQSSKDECYDLWAIKKGINAMSKHRSFVLYQQAKPGAAATTPTELKVANDYRMVPDYGFVEVSNDTSVGRHFLSIDGKAQPLDQIYVRETEDCFTNLAFYAGCLENSDRAQPLHLEIPYLNPKKARAREDACDRF